MTSRVALGAILLGGGILWLFDNAGVLDLSYQVWIGILLIAIGLAIAFTPGHHALLTLVGILVLLAGLPALVAGDLTGDVGDVTKSPATPAEIVDYDHGIGKLTIELTAPGLADEDLDVKANVGIGELLVLVPEAADVTVDAHVGVGNIEALGKQADGAGVDLVEQFAASGDQEIRLELDAGMGDIRVERR